VDNTGISMMAEVQNTVNGCINDLPFIGAPDWTAIVNDHLKQLKRQNLPSQKNLIIWGLLR